MRELGAGLLIIVGLLVGTWIATGNDFFLYKYFAPKQEAVRRQVFEGTKSYNQGMIQELENMEAQYITADKDHKEALADLILHRASGYNLDDRDVSSDLRNFIQKLRDNRSGNGI